MSIQYKFDVKPPVDDIIALYKDAGLNRPIDDRERIAAMYQHANLVITAWDGALLVGISRSLTDFSHCCYLADLAVAKQYQQAGIGKQLIALTKEKISDQSMLLLLSAPAAMDYYPKIGLQKAENAFIIHRST